MTRFICTINPKILRRLERILIRGFLCALRVLAVNAGQHFHREDAKDARKTPRRPFWLRLGCSLVPTRKSLSFLQGFLRKAVRRRDGPPGRLYQFAGFPE